MELVEKTLSLMDRLESEVQKPLTEILRQGMTQLAEDSRLTRSVLSASPEFRRNVNNALRQIWKTSIETGYELILLYFAEGFKGQERKSAEVINLILSRYLESYGAGQAAQILRTSEAQIRDMMAGGMARGEAAEAVYANVLERIPELARLRATVISRTEIHAAVQFASLQTALRSSIPLVKVWNSERDERTRDFGEVGRISQFNHRVMDGTRVPLLSDFLVPSIGGGVEALAFPGDPRGSAGNIINCRCVQSYERAR